MNKFKLYTQDPNKADLSFVGPEAEKRLQGLEKTHNSLETRLLYVTQLVKLQQEYIDTQKSNDLFSNEKYFADIVHRISKLESKDQEAYSIKRALNNFENRLISLEERIMRNSLSQKNQNFEYTLEKTEEKLLKQINSVNETSKEREDLIKDKFFSNLKRLENQIEKTPKNFKENKNENVVKDKKQKFEEIERLRDRLEREVSSREKSVLDVAQVA